MRGNFFKYFEKLFVKQWVIGIGMADIREIIRNKSFIQDIKWLPVPALDHFYADPFLLKTDDGKLTILFEDFGFEEFYGKLSVLTLDDNFKPLKEKVLLDTKSHLSYPFIFKENDKIFVFPEASQTGKLSCYEYDQETQTLSFVQDILNLALLDSSILKLKDKYWLFGTLKGDFALSKLYIFFSDNLFGPFTPHPENPVRNSANGSRPAGDFIEVDGSIYRPSQNCQNMYGESITINKIISLDENHFSEEPYMDIVIDRSIINNSDIHALHTINSVDNIITIDGIKWIFSPTYQWATFLRNRRILRGKQK
jgi:hypothetical protein